MAGTKKAGEFNELVSPFLKAKLLDLSNKYGERSAEYNAISKQYLKNVITFVLCNYIES